MAEYDAEPGQRIMYDASSRDAGMRQGRLAPRPITTFTGWVWDEARKLQYYYNPDDDTYVYQDGTVIAVSRPAQNDT
jgi:hypothetical protein